MALPNRRRLPHVPPSFVPAGDVFFLTLCGESRGKNQFALDAAWERLSAAAAFYHRNHRWHLRLLLAMPDHVHLLAGFPAGEDMRRAVSAFKHYLARTAGFHWQRDFFDHRLRRRESLDEKSAYIRMNPVRAGLTVQPDDWPFWWMPPDVMATPS